MGSFVESIRRRREAMVIAHRGASHDAPENTLAAVRLAWEMNADAVEVDLRLTADAEIVAMHDETTERTCDAALRVREYPLSALRALDAGSRRGERWRGEQIPTVGEILDAVPPDRALVLELKTGPEIVAPLARAIRAARLNAGAVCIITFSFRTAVMAKSMLPECSALHLLPRLPSPRLRAALDRAIRAGLDGVDVAAQPALSARFAAAARDRGAVVLAYTIDNPAAAVRLARVGIHGITTNRPDRIGDALRSRLRLNRARPAAIS